MRRLDHLMLALSLAVGAAEPLVAQAEPRFVNPGGLSVPRGYTQLVDVPPGRHLLFLSGQVPLDSLGRLVGPGDFRIQARQVFENIRLALAGGGATFKDLVKVTFYLRDVRDLTALREIRDQYVNTAAPPASTLVQVPALFRDDVLLEVEAVAVTGP